MFLQFTHGRRSLSGSNEAIRSWILHLGKSDAAVFEPCGAITFSSASVPGVWDGKRLRLTPVDGEGLYYFRGVFYTEVLITPYRPSEREECCALQESRVYEALKDSIKEAEAWLPAIQEYRADALKLYDLLNELHPIKGCVKERGLDRVLSEVREMLRHAGLKQVQLKGCKGGGCHVSTV